MRNLGCRIWFVEAPTCRNDFLTGGADKHTKKGPNIKITTSFQHTLQSQFEFINISGLFYMYLVQHTKPFVVDR